MRNNIVAACMIMLLGTSCVQKTYKQTVVFLLDTKAVKNIHSVGLRGIDKPLSWDDDLQMVALKKDTSYTATVTFLTGYQFTEVKFVINDQFELKDQPNRRITFAKGDTTVFEAAFNSLKTEAKIKL